MERRLLGRNEGRTDDNIDTIRKRFKVGCGWVGWCGEWAGGRVDGLAGIWVGGDGGWAGVVGLCTYATCLGVCQRWHCRWSRHPFGPLARFCPSCPKPKFACPVLCAAGVH
jgi:hypothetical protein